MEKKAHYFVLYLQTFSYLSLFTASPSSHTLISQISEVIRKIPTEDQCTSTACAAVVPVPPCTSCIQHEKEIRPRNYLPLVINFKWRWTLQPSRLPLGMHKFMWCINKCKHRFVRKCLLVWSLGKQAAVAEPLGEASFDSGLFFPPTCFFHTQLTFLVQKQFRNSCIHTLLFQAICEPCIKARQAPRCTFPGI